LTGWSSWEIAYIRNECLVSYLSKPARMIEIEELNLEAPGNQPLKTKESMLAKSKRHRKPDSTLAWLFGDNGFEML